MVKLKKSFITHNVDDTQVMVSIDDTFSGMVKSNPTAAFIINLLKEETTVEEILKSMLETYIVDEATALNAINYTLNKLREINALDE